MTGTGADATAYLRMLRRGRALAGDVANDARPELRVAVLATHATQQFAPVLRAAIDELGLKPFVIEGEYGAMAQEALDPASALYEAHPHSVYVGLAVQAYRERFYAAASPAARESLARDYLDEVLGVVDAIRLRGPTVVVSTLALPVEQLFGSFGGRTLQSPYGSVLRFNELLATALGARSGCFVSDVTHLSARVGGEHFLDDRLWFAAKSPCALRFLPELARSAARVAAVQRGRVTKVLALDLDNTLWGGVVGDDGIDGLALGGTPVGEAFQAFQRYVLALKHRGYVLAIVSKNEGELARRAFREHPEMVLREEDIAVFVANWNDKASNLDYVARVLGLGLDSFVFVDDSPFERGVVRARLPMVAVPEMPDDVADFPRVLEASGLFEATGYSEEDFARAEGYRAEALRTTEQLRFASIDEYLASLEMVMEVGPFRPDQLPRVAQLLQRSNQFNLRTQRLSEGDCEAYAKDPRRLTMAARLRDRLGDYGLIAVACADEREGDLFVTELVMSCRVLRRGVEEALMNHLFARCRERGLRGVRGEWIRTAKNAMVKDLYARFDFERVEGDDARCTWYLPADVYEPRKTQVREVTT